MGEAERDGAAEQKLEQARERLSKIWSDWGLEPDTTMGSAQMNALTATVKWLAGGEKDRGRALRAVQYLLCDPEQPGMHKRACWAPFKKALLKAWSNVSTRDSDVLFLQALLLAAWPEVPSLNATCRLLDPCWDVARGRESQRGELLRWRAETDERSDTESVVQAIERLENFPSNTPDFSNQLAALDSHLTTLNRRIANSQNWQDSLVNFSSSAKEVITLLVPYGEAIRTTMVRNTTLIQQALEHLSASARRTLPEQQLLWWGQARYSHSLRKPYRRFEHQEDITFWAPFEAAKLAHDAATDIEPAASYVVEVLNTLGRDVNEKKPLRAWMASLLQTLQTTGDKAAPVNKPLTALAAEDALGMPVTWVRLQVADKKDLSGADSAVALPLDEEIDRGQWAAWIFRETLLDLHLAQRSDP